jgi:hypothetical protein
MALENQMSRTTYDHHYYWLNQLKKHNRQWEHIHSDTPLRATSCFLQVTYWKDGRTTLNRWIMLPEPHAVVGYLKYILLIRMFTDWLSRDEGYGLVPCFHLPREKILDTFEEDEGFTYRNEIPSMRAYWNKLEPLWTIGSDQLGEALWNYCVELYADWFQRGDHFRIQYFHTLEIMGNFVVKPYIHFKKQHIFEEEMGMSIADWKSVVNRARESNFLRWRLVDILNNRLKNGWFEG